MIPIMLGLFFLSLFVIDWGRGQYWTGRLQTMADATLMSSLRIRVEGLRRVSERWEQFGSLYESGDVNGAFVLSKNRDTISKKATKLKKSISGYKGRIKAVIKVVSEANGVARERVLIEDDSASQLGLDPNSIRIRDESGATKLLEGAWYQRIWGAADRLGEPDGVSTHQIFFNMPLLGRTSLLSATQGWDVSRRAHGRIRWDVPVESLAVQTQGNGGFPRQWGEALNGKQVEPHRYPFFRVELHEN